MLLPIVPGVDFVGRIVSIDSRVSTKLRLKKGDRVLSLCKVGGNSRYIRASPEALVKVPDVDPTDAVCLAETYLAAFQVLHLRQKPSIRHRRGSLAGKNVLVLEALQNVGKAIIELANHAGASHVYATGKEKQRETIRDMGATPLSRRVYEWMGLLKGKIDLIIDATGDEETGNLETLRALNDSGKYIFLGQRMDFMATEKAKEDMKGMASRKNGPQSLERVVRYDVFENWDGRPDTCKVRIWLAQRENEAVCACCCCCCCC